jgi:hypothetical protein
LRLWDMPHVAVAVGKHHMCDMQHPFMQSATWAMRHNTIPNSQANRRPAGLDAVAHARMLLTGECAGAFLARVRLSCVGSAAACSS